MVKAVNQEPILDKSLRNRAWRDIALYGLARLALFIVLTVIIQSAAYLIGAPVPLLISALLGLLVAFPLSMFVFKGLRLKVNEELAEWDAQRKAHKAWVKKELAER
ncbi:DUF4229 domain-containing protein [Corynebacterium hindlerae]|uniref:DUF4229 domain-containing protein n=1 Tax=Corynebacterium hindlerae TaxID=699041 RepID=A0A7G5FHX2_9CORY|nr:DUF4229 domain-containing protein [Corynebacterium hindlerae]QMV86213.1 DUF4229 domain-containing protein [Corynebacterium hindlerae]